MKPTWASGERVAGRFEIAAVDDAGALARGPGGATVRLWPVADAKLAARAARRAARAGVPGVVTDVEAVAGEGGVVWAATLPGEAVAAPLDEETALDLAREVGSVLAAAHERRLVHGAPRLADVRRVDRAFVLAGPGLSQARGRGRGPGGGVADERDDIAGLGHILYMALTGAPPFEVPAEELPLRFRPTVLRCLQKDPQRRYGSVTEVLIALGLSPAAQVVAARRAPVRVVAGLVAVVAVAAGAAVWQPWRRGEGGAAAGVVVADAGVPVNVPIARPVLRVAPFAAELPESDRWLARGAEDTVVAWLEGADVEVIRGAGGTPGELRAAGVDLLVDGRVAARGAGFTVEARLVDLRGGAMRVAAKLDVADVAGVQGAAAAHGKEMRENLAPGGQPASPAPTLPPPALWAAEARALSAFADGDADGALAALDEALAADAKWPPALVLRVEVLAAAGREGEAARAAADARAVVPAGSALALRLDAAAGETLAARVRALEALAELRPHDPKVAVELTRAYRAAGRAEDCVSAGQRALALDAGAVRVHRELVDCHLARGDADAAVAAARAWATALGDSAWELVGDVELARARFGAARDAWRKAGAAGRLPLWEWHARGQCKQAALSGRQAVGKLGSGAIGGPARVWALVALACGDVWQAREAEDAARRGGDAASAKLIAYATAVTRGKGVWSDGQALAEAAGDDETRAIAWAFALQAARRGKQAAAAVAAFGAPGPTARFFRPGPPLLWELALAQLDAGDVEAGRATCAEVRKLAPDWAPGHYCVGRAAEAAQKWSEAFNAYRAFLDRWADADEENRLVVDVKRRVPRVIAEARKPKPPAPAPAPAP